MKHLSLCVVLTLFINAVFSQELFRFADKKITAKEFLAAYNKAPEKSKDRKKAIDDYLNLYINFKLKVQDAYDEGLDKNESFLLEVADFKQQLAQNFMNKEANLDMLLKECEQRAGKDIRLAQIFIEFKEGGDTLNAYKKIQEAYRELKEGKSFHQVSTQYTTNENIRKQNGDLGFITVFSLPYDIENLVYGMKNGEVTKPYKTKNGYHIFKRVGDRDALGRAKISQLLFYTPEKFNADEKLKAERLADSVYQLLQQGHSFTDLLSKVADNYNPYNPNTGTYWISVGDYDPAFEQKVFELKKPGSFSKPFFSGFGYTIIRLEEKQNVNDESYKSFLQKTLMNDERLESARKKRFKEWAKKADLKINNVDFKNLMGFTDSIMRNTSLNNYNGLSRQTVLFSFKKEEITIDTWLRFYNKQRMTDAGYLKKSFEERYADFIDFATEDYVKKHLEDFHSEFANQLKEFEEASLLFSIMDKKVWTPSLTDTAGLLKTYEANAQKYFWKPGVAAVIFTTASKELADQFKNNLKNNLHWRELVGKSPNEVVADSNRFELDQLPISKQVKMEKGWISDIEPFGDKGSYVFIMVTDVFPEPQKRTFHEARGMVMSDYQKELEKQWLMQLRKKFPVIINRKTLAAIKK